MNIVQLHERTRFWLDTVGSTRFESLDLDNALNASQNDIVEQKYQASRLINKGDSFQRTQKVRDELSNIVKYGVTGSGFALQNSTGIPVGETTRWARITAASFPEDYKYLLACAIHANDSTETRYNCWPLTYDRINVTDRNPFRRVRLSPFPKFYYIESESGITIYHALAADAKKIGIYYLSAPIQMQYGIEYVTGHDFTEGDVVIVVSESAVYNTVTYLLGDEITILPGILQISSGTVISNYVETNINSNLHELIARKAAINALLSVKEFDKSKALIEHFI